MKKNIKNNANIEIFLQKYINSKVKDVKWSIKGRMKGIKRQLWQYNNKNRKALLLLVMKKINVLVTAHHT